MEQSETSATTTTADRPAAVPRNTTEPPVNRNKSTISNSVPSLRFPRPLGNRQLTNWVSSSSPDIMRPGNFQDEAPLDDSIADLGYEFIGTDGESQPESTTSSYDHQIPELSDDVHSLADTDTGTDADINDVDTESSDDEEQLPSNPPSGRRATIGPYHTDEGDEADVETMADRSLEHPTELFTPDPASVSRRTLSSAQGIEEQRSWLAQYNSCDSEQPRRDHVSDNSDEKMRDKANKTSSRLAPWLSTLRDSTKRSSLRDLCFNQDGSLRPSVVQLLLMILTFGVAYPLTRYMTASPPGHDGVISTVPVASVSIAAPPTTAEAFIPTTAVSSTLTSATTPKALQTTSSTNSVAYLLFTKDKTAAGPNLDLRQNLCSAELHGRNEILLKIPEQLKSTWLAKQSLLVSVSRGANDISPKSTKISTVDEGFLIKISQKEAHGILDVSIATTRKPKINETFQVNFGRYMIVEAYDVGKQLVKGLAQSVVDTVNGTTAWVEETCMPAFDTVSKQVSGQTASVSDSVLQSFRDALDRPTQLAGQIKRSLSKDMVKDRVYQVEVELLRDVEDARGEMGLGLLAAQINAKLWWLKLQGKTDEHQRYLEAAELYYKRHEADVLVAREQRAERAKKEIQARRKQQPQEVKRSFWGASKRDF